MTLVPMSMPGSVHTTLAQQPEKRSSIEATQVSKLVSFAVESNRKVRLCAKNHPIKLLWLE